MCEFFFIRVYYYPLAFFNDIIATIIFFFAIKYCSYFSLLYYCFIQNIQNKDIISMTECTSSWPLIPIPTLLLAAPWLFRPCKQSAVSKQAGTRFAEQNQDQCILPSVWERHPRPHYKGGAINARR